MRVALFLLGCFLLGAPLYLSAQTAPPPHITRDRGGKPNWTGVPDAAFPRAFYVAAVGTGSSRAQADGAAFAALTGLFGQSVKANLSAVEGYRERVINGKVSLTASHDTLQAIEISASMDSLIGAEIFDRWDDPKTRVYYAVAAMDKHQAAAIYGELFDANLDLILQTLELSRAEKNSFTGIARYRFAARLADANAVFARVLTVLGVKEERRGSHPSGDEYRAEAQAIARQIPIFIEVSGDSQRRLAGAFTASVTEAGFRTAAARGRYTLKAVYKAAPAVITGSEYFYTRFNLDAQLVDTQDGAVILSWAFNERSGHTSQAEANNRAVFDAEHAIAEDFSARLSAFLAAE